MRRLRQAVLSWAPPAALLVASLVAGCGGSGTAATHGPRRDLHILRVPSRYHTIQSAVNASTPGDTILIAPGVYHEAVTVGARHPRITIRGVNRNTVILDGESGRLISGITVTANNVSVENLTVRRYAVNGLVFAPHAGWSDGSTRALDGWRASYITAYDNGLYGVYALQAHDGELDHVYASGQPDSGIYVGQCRPCEATVTASTMTDNAVGYEDTNASGVTVRGNLIVRNRIGALLDSNLVERRAPQSHVLFEHNTVAGNDNARAPTGGQGFGSGVVISGGDDDRVQGNAIAAQRIGVLVINAPADVGGFQATDNRVSANTLTRDSLDLGLLTGASSQGNCFSGNRPHRTFPIGVQSLTVCGRSVAVPGTAPPLPSNPPQIAFLSIPAPPPQRSMP